MLIWYSQEARSYALLVFFGALSLLFFARALDTRPRPRPGLLGAGLGAGALQPLLRRLRGRDRGGLAAGRAAGALAGRPAGARRRSAPPAWRCCRWPTPRPTRPTSAGSKTARCRERFWETGGLLPDRRNRPRDRRGAARALRAGPDRPRRPRPWSWSRCGAAGGSGAAAAIGAGAGPRRRRADGASRRWSARTTWSSATCCRRWCRCSRSSRSASPPPAPAALGLLLAVALCAYWLAFDVHVTQTPNLQRPDFRTVTDALGPPRHGRRAIVTWKLAADPVRYYLHDGAVRMYGGEERIGEIDVLRKPLATGQPVNLPPSFHQVGRVRADRLTAHHLRLQAPRENPVPHPARPADRLRRRRRADRRARSQPPARVGLEAGAKP